MKEKKLENVQMEKKRSLEELNVMDDFLMNAAASDPEGGAEFCCLLLSTLLEREIGEVRINVQKMVPSLTPGLRGIRMDVEVVEEAGPILNIYDIEPCQYYMKKVNIARRNRYYQGRIDGRYLKSGDRSFETLPDLFTITILPYDPFGQNYMMYSFRTTCEELPGLDYPDGLRYIYFNTRGEKGGSPAIRQMLDYLQKSTEENAKGTTLQRMHQHVKKLKISPEVKEEYMLWEEKIYWEREDAARKKGIKYILSLLEDYGTVPKEIRTRIEAEEDSDTMDKWLKLAARCGSMEAFAEKM